MKLTTKDKNKVIPVSVISETGEKYGIVVGTDYHMICVLLNIGEYVDVPDHIVKRIYPKAKEIKRLKK
ncbi:hypothetical protein [Lacrimispora sp.]|jgi:hypothetical protein|uniref:hypothetical protein n=1 Tax=Lacrimispora sp. TaxID=2719234 RepID=UPI0028ACF139|nr:hypothetical protein [Lacrimispora sp.]